MFAVFINSVQFHAWCLTPTTRCWPQYLCVEMLKRRLRCRLFKLQVLDETTPGVPSGWLLFRDVKPTRAVPRRDEAHILNALCPLRDIEPHYVGGIRLTRRTWLAGFPPRIRFTGELEESFV